jgi:hypothetical protein
MIEASVGTAHIESSVAATTHFQHNIASLRSSERFLAMRVIIVPEVGGPHTSMNDEL